MKKILFIAALALVVVVACNKEDDTTDRQYIECPSSIAKEALEYAYKYNAADTEYKWGGRDLIKSIKIDCSGLAVNCYRYATSNSLYCLPFSDATVIDFYTTWTIPTNYPREGDIIFMGDNSTHPTHMSIFVKSENGYIHFIDSTLKPEESINGVSVRKYESDDTRFLSFGRMKLLLN